MCGLFGFSGKKGKRVNLDKLIILGLYNESRGTDSCGYYYDGNVEWGVGADAKFSNFITKTRLKPGDLKGKIFMGHTRKGTVGGSTLENAHPHVVNENYVQTHNGTIREIWKLCTDHGVDHGKIQVDSLGLAELIVKAGPKIILEAYKGSAALAFTYMNKPESLYLYHGKSKEAKYGEPLSERPLFVLFQAEGMYYSSIKESLDAINSAPEKVQPLILQHNAVHEVIEGEFSGGILKIDREENNVTNFTYSGNCQSIVPIKNKNTSNNYSMKPKYSMQTGLPLDPDEEVNLNDMILQEKLPELIEENVNRIFYCKGRYYTCKRYERVQATEKIYNLLLDGEIVINRDGFIVEGITQKLGPREERCYFLSGLMMKSKDAYNALKKEGIMGMTTGTFRILSSASKYPIIQIANHLGEGSNLWYHNGEKVKKDNFTPRFVGKKYKIKYGKTKQILLEKPKPTLQEGVPCTK
jgi:hypothetical protein